MTISPKTTLGVRELNPICLRPTQRKTTAGAPRVLLETTPARGASPSTPVAGPNPETVSTTKTGVQRSRQT